MPIHTDKLTLGTNVTIDPSARIRGKSVTIGDDTYIGPNVDIRCPDGFTLGACSRIGPNSKIECWRFEAGAYLYCDRNLEVGRGGCLSSPDSVVEIGSGVQLNEGVILNPNCRVAIGDDVGIGAQTSIWTHGAYLSTHPSKFEPVHIGNRVWLQGGSKVLPGVVIGDDSVVGMGSVVTKSLPSRSLCGGTPCKVIKYDCYPKGTDWGQLEQMIQDYLGSLSWRRVDASKVYVHGNGVVLVDNVVFNLSSLCATGEWSPLAEDFRDFIRRRGYRIYTGKPFKSLPHPDIQRWGAAC